MLCNPSSSLPQYHFSFPCKFSYFEPQRTLLPVELRNSFIILRFPPALDDFSSFSVLFSYLFPVIPPSIFLHFLPYFCGIPSFSSVFIYFQRFSCRYPSISIFSYPFPVIPLFSSILSLFSAIFFYFLSFFPPFVLPFSFIFYFFPIFFLLFLYFPPFSPFYLNDFLSFSLVFLALFLPESIYLGNISKKNQFIRPPLKLISKFWHQTRHPPPRPP